MRVALVMLRHDLLEAAFDFQRVLARRQIGAVADPENMVSTAMVGSPNATFSTTLAVLRPTPGSSSSASRSFGTSPPCRAISILDIAITRLALPR